MATLTRADTLELVGGRLCLDFTNTVSARETSSPNERLTSYAELVAWSRHARILTPEAADRLSAIADRQPAEAERVLHRAVALRDAIYRLFSARAREAPPEEDDLSTFNGEFMAAMPQLRLVSSPAGFGVDWIESQELDRMLWPVVKSAAELLASAELYRVRECGGPTCNWLFLDTTKNHSRRWCDMKDCGNRAKARRHYARIRSDTGMAIRPAPPGSE